MATPYCRHGHDCAWSSECLFSRAVEVCGEDKVSKRKWLRMLAKILAQQARRQTMDPAQRGSPMFSSQHNVYEHQTFAPRFRSCVSVPYCVPGACKAGCVCDASNRKAASDAALQKRLSVHAEPSTRHKYHTSCKGPIFESFETSFVAGVANEDGIGVACAFLTLGPGEK